jgi:hypothetical protein
LSSGGVAVVISDVNVSRSVQEALDELFAFLPALVGALLILIIGYFVARLVGRLIASALHRAGFDRTVTTGTAGAWVSKVTSEPSRLIGKIVFWALFLGAVSLAVSALGINALTAFVGAVFAYLPNVIAAVLIFLVASAVAAGVAALATRTMGDTPTGKVVATVVPGIVMAIAVFMILNQLKIAPAIVTITYAALIGSLALAAALAFGLGGREVAAEMLRGAYVKGQQQTEQVRRDLQVGRARAQVDIERAQQAMGSDDLTPARYDLDNPRGSARS